VTGEERMPDTRHSEQRQEFLLIRMRDESDHTKYRIISSSLTMGAFVLPFV
jgi:hypothetical protein